MALLVAGATIALGVAMLLGAGLQLAWWQWALVVVVAFDIGGGVIANATPAAARQYHRPDRPWEPLLFAAGHVHPFVIAWLLPGYSWLAGATLYIATMVAVVATLLTPPDLRRPAALFFSAVGITAVAGLTGDGWGWLAPLLILKLVAGHATLGGSR